MQVWWWSASAFGSGTGNTARVVTVVDAARSAALGVAIAHAQYSPAHLREASEVGSRGHYVPFVGEVFPTGQIADAHCASETGHTQGKIVVTI